MGGEGVGVNVLIGNSIESGRHYTTKHIDCDDRTVTRTVTGSFTEYLTDSIDEALTYLFVSKD